jgi:hypothetical protein
MGLVRFRVRRAYPGYGRGVAADVRPRTRSITVHSWRNLGLAMRGRLSRAWCPPDGGSTARGSGRKRTTRSRLAAALGCRRQRATQKFGRTQIGTRDADPSAPPCPTSASRRRPALRLPPDRQPAGAGGLPLRIGAQSSLPLLREWQQGKSTQKAPWGETGFSQLAILSCIIHSWRLMI